MPSSIDMLWPNPEDANRVRYLQAASNRASLRIQQEAIRDGDISGPRMAEILREELPHLTEIDANKIVLAVHLELNKNN